MTQTLSMVHDLLPEISKRAEDVERGRGLPAELVDSLRAAGCLRMMVPGDHGGDELTTPDALRVIEKIATADGSVAWSVGQVALSQLIILCGPRSMTATIFSDGPDVYAAGAVAPKGRATATDGGWRIAGQWPFVTGCKQARWLYLNCVLVRDRIVQLSANGAPATRIMVIPATEVTVVDTWRTLGLRGTGSHDVLVSGVHCPDEYGLVLAEGDPATDRAAANIAQSSLIIAAVATGIAAGALDDTMALALGGKRPSLSGTRLAASTVFQDHLGEAQATLRAARALLYAEADVAWARTAAGQPSSPLQRGQTRAAAAQVTTLATQVVDSAYGLGGGSAVYDTSPLQRRLRDAHTATQHFVGGRNSYAVVGAMLMGEPVDTGPF